MVTMSGADALAEAVRECGIDYFFYMRGGFAGTWEKALQEKGVKVVLCRGEIGACGMADGYSRVTRKPSVCYAQHGAAAAILASVMYEPMYAHSPVIAVTGSIPTTEKHRWQYQECYEMPYFEPTSKFNADVTDVSRIAEYVRIATQVAVSGCPGPTHITVHNDMTDAIAEMPDICGDRTFNRVPPFRPRPEPERVAEAAALLLSAERPVIACGSGVHISEAYDEVKALAEFLAAPVVTNYKGKGSFPEHHPLSIGVMGTYGKESANEIVRGSDLVFFIGFRADSHSTEDLTAPKPGTSRIIHLDIDPVVIGRNYRTDVALVGDAMMSLRDLLDILKRTPLKRGTHRADVARQIESDRTVEATMDSDVIPVKPQRLMKEISKVLLPRDIVVSDTGQMLCWTNQFLKLKGAGLTYIPSCGTLGYSLPLAIGVSFGAQEDQRVLNLIGDGGVVYSLAELETAKRYKDQHVPLVTVVNNNSSLAMGRPKFMELAKDHSSLIEFCDLGSVNFAKMAEALGCYGVRVEKPEEIAEATNSAFESGRPALVDVVTDRTETAAYGRTRKPSKHSPFSVRQ